MSPASMLVARNVREDIGTGFVAALLLASAVLLLCIATLGSPGDDVDGVMPAAATASQPESAAAFAGAPVYRLPPLTVVGRRDGTSSTVAGETLPSAAAPETQAKHSPRA